MGSAGENADQNSLSSLGLGPLGWLANQGVFGEGAKKFVNQATYDLGINNVVGEISGGNRKRQREWQERVAADAKAAQDQEIAQRNRDAMNADLSASRAGASGTRSFTGAGGDFAYKNPSGDVTDFLGL